MTACQISFNRARDYIKKLQPVGVEEVELSMLSKRTAACDIVATLDSPTADSSLKDGYAVVSDDIRHASKDNPIDLKIRGTVLAGDMQSVSIRSGETFRIMTGATVPEGATAVLASEFAVEKDHGNRVTALADAKTGKNILVRGGEISAGLCLVKRGQLITPALVGVLAASGVSSAMVYTLPKVALLATGSEIVQQGESLANGQIFQSNQYVAQSWLKNIGIDAEIFLIRDDYDTLLEIIDGLLSDFDIIITSGGLLAGDRDLVLPVMDRLGTSYLFKRINMGPGKGVCLGICRGRTIFNLPGGPPSNYLAFMLLALPGILRISGMDNPFRPVLKARLQGEIRGRKQWTQFIFARKQWGSDGILHVKVCNPGSRLMKIAMSDCAVEVPEDTEILSDGEWVRIHDFGLL